VKTLKAFVDSYVSFDTEEWAELEERLELRTYRKGEMICSSYDVWDTLYFIRSGLIRSYIMTEEGREVTRQFHFNNDKANILNLFVVDYKSMTQQEPSTIGFEVLEDCELISIKAETIDYMHSVSKKWERLSRMVLESVYVTSSVFYQSIITRSAKENYRYICDNMSHLIELVPQYHLATYIGITPVSLSRIKQEVESQKKPPKA